MLKNHCFNLQDTNSDIHVDPFSCFSFYFIFRSGTMVFIFKSGTSWSYILGPRPYWCPKIWIQTKALSFAWSYSKWQRYWPTPTSGLNFSNICFKRYILTVVVSTSVGNEFHCKCILRIKQFWLKLKVIEVVNVLVNYSFCMPGLQQFQWPWWASTPCILVGICIAW